ncbi:MAG: porin PorA family protein [Thermoplasmatota archaeon]
MSKKRHAMIIVGLVFFIVAPSFAFVLTPSMKRIPDDLNKVVYYEGTLGMFNDRTLTMDYIDISIKREVTAIGTEDGVLLIRENITISDKRTGEVIPDGQMTNIYGIDPYTSRNVPGYGDTERIGQYIFPVGVDKKDYVIWNSDMDQPYTQGYVGAEDATGIGHYLGEEKRGGITVYKFYGEQEEICIGPGPEGTPPEARLFYKGHQTAWADPKTGSIIDYDKRVIQYLQFPDLHRLPSDLYTTVQLSGTVKMFNMDKVGSGDYYDHYDARITQHIWVDDASDQDVYMVGSETIARDSRGNLLPDELQSSSMDGVNPVTMAYDPLFSDKQGLMTFPVGIEPRDYDLWNGDIGTVSTARYLGQETVGGLPVYRYVVTVDDYPSGIQHIPGMSDRHVELYFNGTTTYWVEPTTGGIVNVEKQGVMRSSFPDLHTIPEDTHVTVDMQGSLWILGSGERTISMTREVTATDTYYEDGDKVIVLKDNTTMHDAETGDLVPEGSSITYHGVYADTAEEAPNYGDMLRQGIYTFPVGVEKTTYHMWNPEISTTSPVEFVREEDHQGIHTYLYQTEETRRVYDPTPGIEQDVQYTTLTKYWVEPHSGSVIDMEKYSEKKVNLLNFIFGIPGPLWVNAYRMTLSFTDSQVQQAVEEGRKAAALLELSDQTIPALTVNVSVANLADSLAAAKMQKMQVSQLSGSKIKAADIHYWMTEESVQEYAKEAKTTGFLLTFMEAILPSLLVVLGIALVALWVINRPRG